MIKGGCMNEKNMEQSISNLLPAAATADSIAQIDPASVDVVVLLKRHELLMELSAIASDMIDSTDEKHLCEHICRRLRDITGAANVYIATESHDRTCVDLRFEAARDETKHLNQKQFTPMQGAGGKAWFENQTVHAVDYENCENKIVSPMHIVEALAVPLRRGSLSYGVLTLLFDTCCPSDLPDNMELYERFAVMVSSVLQNARKARNWHMRNYTLERMLRINQAIYESDDLLQIVDSILRMIIDGFHATRARIYRYDEGQWTGLLGLRLLNENDANAAVISEEELAKSEILNESAAIWAMRNLQPAHIRPEQPDPRESLRVHHYRKEIDMGGTYIVPLICSGSPWGMLSVSRGCDAPAFTQEEKRLVDVIASQISLTSYRQNLMDRIEYQASYDQLTGLINRTSFEYKLTNQIAAAKHKNKSLSLLFIDLDGFKIINDTMGHMAGDELLQQVARRLSEFSIDGNLVGRIGGDEFAVLANIGESHENVLILANQLAESIGTGYEINGLPTSIQASVGVSHYPSDGSCADELLVSADIAMYQAKRDGRGVVCEFDSDFAWHHTRSMALKIKLQFALQKNEFVLHYQPKVSGETGQVVGVEALIRWHNAEFDMVSPAEWIPLAEESTAIIDIGNWVLEEACNALTRFNAAGLNINLAVNISAVQFLADDFIESTFEIIKKTGASVSQLEFEVTETALIEDLDLVIAKLQALKNAGVRVAIDDFGVKYSSLAYLAELPVDVLKIDRDFVSRLDEPGSRSMVEPILKMAQSLDLETVAEGIETENQLKYLCSLGCDLIQGYYFSRPVPENDVVETINKIDQRSLPKLDRHAA